jgi:HPr Serine kinase C-terminal domain
MTGSVLSTPAVNDPLLTTVPLECEVVLYPYGFPVRIRSNSSLTIEAAERSWKSHHQRFDHSPLDIRLLLSESDSPSGMEDPVFRSQGHLLSIVVDRENFACLDLKAGLAFGWATRAIGSQQEYFRQWLLDVMIYPLLEIQHLTTLHAACVIKQGKGVLLAGNSGAGKSSLSYACARRGWTFVSDDASAFQREVPRPMVIGNPHKFRFREAAGELFPELIGFKSTHRAYGKPTIEVRTETLEGIKRSCESSVDAIVFLNRPDHDGDAPSLRSLSPEEAWERLSFSVWAIQMPAFDQRLAALHRLLDLPIYEMKYSALNPAIDLLERLVEDRA